MHTEFLNILNDVSPLSDTSKLLLSEYIQVKKVRKKDFLLNYGETCKHIYFINEGFLRIFYYKNSKDITEWFAKEKHFCFSISSYFEEIPSKLIIEALEDSEILAISKVGFEKLRRTNLDVANLFIELISGSLIGSQIRMDSIQFETAEQRYTNLLKDQPEILKVVPLQYVATYLGITKETLSRIRAKE
jgi:CRP-like cAMP-binding protein